MPEAYIIDAARTPRGIGKVGKGALADFHPQHLAATVLKALAERNNLKTGEVDDVIWGTSSQRGKQGGDMGRMAALDAGFDIKASGMTLDRFCGSGITVVNLAAASIMSGNTDWMQWKTPWRFTSITRFHWSKSSSVNLAQSESRVTSRPCHSSGTGSALASSASTSCRWSIRWSVMRRMALCGAQVLGRPSSRAIVGAYPISSRARS